MRRSFRSLPLVLGFTLGVLSSSIAFAFDWDREARDFNGDGFDDLFARPSGVGATNVSVYKIWLQRDGAVLEECFVPTGGGAFVFAGHGDFNGDGRTDLVLEGQSGTPAQGIVRIDLSGNGCIPERRWMTTAGGQWRYAGRSDANGDGTDELLFAGPIGVEATKHVLMRRLNATSGHQSTYISARPRSWELVAAADIDRDGSDELIFHTPIATLPFGLDARIVELTPDLESVASNTYLTPGSFSPGVSVSSGFLGDFARFAWRHLATGDGLYAARTTNTDRTFLLHFETGELTSATLRDWVRVTRDRPGLSYHLGLVDADDDGFTEWAAAMRTHLWIHPPPPETRYPLLLHPVAEDTSLLALGMLDVDGNGSLDVISRVVSPNGGGGPPEWRDIWALTLYDADHRFIGYRFIQGGGWSFMPSTR